MQLKTFGSKGSSPHNSRLRGAIAKLGDEPSDDRRAALHESLAAGPLLLAFRELPQREENPEDADEWNVRFVTSPGPDGGLQLCAFSDPEAVAARAPAGVWVALDPLSVLKWVVEANFEGLLLNSQGPSAEISRDEVFLLLGLPERRRRRQALSLGDEPENAIREALERVEGLAYGEAGVQIRERRTRKGVQFSLTPDGALMLDVPRAALSRDEAERARILLDDLSGHTLEEGESDPSNLQALFSGDPGRAAKAAVKVFTWVFGFAPGFELDIEEP